MGQNFLISQEFRQKIIEAAELSPEDTVIEVGAGDGSLTFEIAEKAKLVLAVEKDKRFAEALEKIVSEQKIKNIIVINEDILKVGITSLLTPPFFKIPRAPFNKGGIGTPERREFIPPLLKEVPAGQRIFARNNELIEYKLIGNIPYYLTSRLLRKFLAEEELKPREIILTVQKEVAERIIAKPPRMNLLALSVQAYGKPEIIEKIPANSFWPKPKVDSAIIKISEISDKFFVLNRIDQENFFSVIKTCFQQKRKKLANSLAKFFGDKKTAEEAIKKSGLAKNARPEELSLKDWIKLQTVRKLLKLHFRHSERSEESCV